MALYFYIDKKIICMFTKLTLALNGYLSYGNVYLSLKK